MSTIKVDTIQKANGSVPTAGDLGLNISGTVLQVVEASREDSTSTTNSSFTDTGLSANITPSSSSNKVLALADLRGGTSGASRASNYNIVRGSTEICETTVFTVSASTSISIVLMKLDSPSTTSETTYKVQFKTDGSGTVNCGTATNAVRLILLEVAG